MMSTALSTSARPRTRLSPARRFRNLLMGALIALSPVLVVAPLILIFAYLLREGLGAMNLDFFTKTPAPEGETGGGLLAMHHPDDKAEKPNRRRR